MLGTPYIRKKIKRITFLDTLDDAPEDTYDVSAAEDNSVQAWFRKNEDYFDLYIAGKGGVTANEDCQELFESYWNVTEINFNDCFYTDNVTTMDSMFSCCFDLEELDLSCFNTENVENMRFMFSSMSALREVNLSSFDTRKVTTMTHMFWSCDVLETLDLSSFEVGAETKVNEMFEDCPKLKTIIKNFEVPDPTPKPTAKPTAKPTVKSYEYNYPTLSRGAQGDAVFELQVCLIDGGYLAYGEADGSYGKKTATAVHRFKKENGIGDYCSDAAYCQATSEMLSVLYSGNARNYSEPEIALVFPDHSNMNYSNESRDMLKFRVEVQNASSWRTVEAFEIRAYAVDDWDNPIYGEGYSYYETTKKTVKPGETVYSSYLYIPNRSDIYKVYVGISKVRYSDGTTCEAYPIDYWHWEF